MHRAEGNEGKSGSARAEIFQLALIVATAVLLAFAVQAYAVKPFMIPSGSMRPTLEPGQRVLVDRATEHLGYTPEIGDDVVFNPPLSAVPAEWPKDADFHECAESSKEREPGTVCSVSGAEHADQAFIKRVVAGPGDTLSIRRGIPIVNGEPVEGDWRTIPCGNGPGCDYPTEIVVPDDSYFMMGDNRPGSEDSRFWGPVPRDWIIGRAMVTYWPPSRIGGL
jgi:signal peptidase I